MQQLCQMSQSIGILLVIQVIYIGKIRLGITPENHARSANQTGLLALPGFIEKVYVFSHFYQVWIVTGEFAVYK